MVVASDGVVDSALHLALHQILGSAGVHTSHCPRKNVLVRVK